MIMNKIILVFLAVLLFAGLVFANTSNSIHALKVHYDSSSSQLTINTTCKAWNVATLTLSNGSSREISCETTGIVPQTWLIPMTDAPLTATLNILAPCDVCSLTVKVNESPTNNWLGMGMILGVLIIGAVVFVAIFNKFGEHPRY